MIQYFRRRVNVLFRGEAWWGIYRIKTSVKITAKPILPFMSEELLHEVGEALRQFAQQEDLNPKKNLPVQDFREGGRSRYNFRRGNFNSDFRNRVSEAIAAHEDGIEAPLVQIAVELQEEGVTLELDKKRIGDTGKTLIMGIILVCRGNALELCGLK